MEKIQPGKYVELGYDLYRITPTAVRELVHQTDASDPEKVIFGVTRGMIRPSKRLSTALRRVAPLT